VNLTEQQRTVVVEAPGDFLLLACPGSGKTRSAAGRIARLARDPGTKVAACSYTNVGAERLSTMIARDAGVLLGPEHFTGTIHAFLLRYVLYPFGHLLGAQQGPHVREGRGWPDLGVGGDHRKRVSLDDFRNDATGELVVSSPPRFARSEEAQAKLIELVGTEVRNRKAGIFRATGAVTADDAMWIALEILRTRPEIAALVAARFDELLLDEAQDTSELQLACLAELRKTGKLASLVLIGDLEQSIYSFQGASAEGCRALAGDHDLREEHLTQNHRCSQLICNVAAKFTSREEPDEAVGPHADCRLDPEIVIYPVADPTLAMRVFRGRLETHGIAAEEAAVLARRRSVAHQLNGVTAPVDVDDRPWRVGRIASDLSAGRLTRNDVVWVQQTLAYCAWDLPHLDELSDDQRAAVRPAAYHFLRDLPALAGDLRTWIREAANVLHSSAQPLADELCHTGGRTLRSKTTHADHQAAEVFSVPEADLSAQTVHSMKGEERAAVMVVIHRSSANDPTAQLDLWGETLAGEEIAAERAEERRVTFVALTRAERYCLVAVPDTPRGREITAACGDLGFALIEAT
jgi:DNA helicase-2/ATP-dependent DNA helicase PcrA